MEFIAGIVFTLFMGFIGNKIYQARKRKAERAAFVPSPRNPRDYPKSNDLP